MIINQSLPRSLLLPSLIMFLKFGFSFLRAIFFFLVAAIKASLESVKPDNVSYIMGAFTPGWLGDVLKQGAISSLAQFVSAYVNTTIAF